MKKGKKVKNRGKVEDGSKERKVNAKGNDKEGKDKGKEKRKKKKDER